MPMDGVVDRMTRIREFGNWGIHADFLEIRFMPSQAETWNQWVPCHATWGQSLLPFFHLKKTSGRNSKWGQLMIVSLSTGRPGLQTSCGQLATPGPKLVF